MESSKNIPTVFIIFGATGDLMAKKIAPALLNLYISGKFPKLFKIIAFSRRDLTLSDFQEHLRTILKNHKDKRIKTNDIEDFLQYFIYQKGNFDTVDAYNALSEKLGRIDGEWKACSNKLFYLAVPPNNYQSIFEHLKTSGLTIPCGPDEGWTRVIVEKPFGKDAKTAQDLDELLGNLFKEEQIYRIDHYLGKDMLQNILSFRFNNDLFEDSWDNDHIEKIEIKFLESIGIEGRSTFYDGVGALRDVGQNHMLQMVAFVTMHQPNTYTADDVREKRTEILSTLVPLNESDIKTKTTRGQYEGYKDVEGVSPDTDTETYFKLEARLSDPTWEGVPIILEAGKNLERRKEIAVTFKHRTPCLCPPGMHYKNRILFTLEPKEEITIEFWAKKPGLDFAMEKQKLSFLFKDERKKAQYVREYEKLLLDCISGNQISFVSTEEVKAMWNFVDPIIEAWEKNVVPLNIYKPKGKRLAFSV
jgi:glucose-6-phosphate 1-dehydrogenase